MNLILSTAPTLILTVQSAAAFAAPDMPAIQPAGALAIYAVSGILRSTADSNISKVVQGSAVARSLDEAVDVLSPEALVKYPGRSIMDTVATRLPITKPTCGLSV